MSKISLNFTLFELLLLAATNLAFAGGNPEAGRVNSALVTATVNDQDRGVLSPDAVIPVQLLKCH